MRADEKVKSSVIMDIMDAAQEAQYKKMVVAGEPLTKKTQKMLEAEKLCIESLKKTPNISSLWFHLGFLKELIYCDDKQAIECYKLNGNCNRLIVSTNTY